jgi:hypothetical protein
MVTMATLMWACGGPSDAPGAQTPTASETGPADTAAGTDGLYGTAPASDVPLPAFAGVFGMDGAARTPADLVGHPTVLWFYPAAGTGG